MRRAKDAARTPLLEASTEVTSSDAAASSEPGPAPPSSSLLVAAAQEGKCAPALSALQPGTTPAAPASPFAAAGIGTMATPESVGMSSDRLQELRSVTRGYVDDGKLPMVQVMVARCGKLIYHDTYSTAPVEETAIYRIYSMSKPITCVAAAVCFERGCFQLDDPVSKYLPEWGGVSVLVGGARVPAASPITIRHLFCHLAGVVEPVLGSSPAHKITAQAKLGDCRTLAEWSERAAQCPLFCHPGEKWHYGAGHTVLGRCVEVWSGLTLEEFLQQTIFMPLGMADTSFVLDDEKRRRLVPLYAAAAGPGQGWCCCRRRPDQYRRIPAMFSNRSLSRAAGGMFDGSGGLCGTAADYMRFALMLANEGTGACGTRILSEQTVKLMTTNQLPDNSTIAAMGIGESWAGMSARGLGFGLGMGIVLEPASAQLASAAGSFFWGGMASTFFNIDPAQQTVAVVMTQVMGGSMRVEIRLSLRRMVTQAIVSEPPRM